MELYSESYKAKCIRKLKEWGAPLDGWERMITYDVAEDEDYDDAVLTECELCGCKRVRYVHVMRNPRYFEDIEVGCICAGIMEGDILAAKERERKLKNRSRRRQHFVKKKWEEIADNIWVRTYKYHRLQIVKDYSGQYTVSDNSRCTKKYRGRTIDNFLSASYAAYDLADPKESVKHHA
ncbi:MAG: hypothetical protein PHE06_07160 [Lachnospiraceae bacterium]|nr:hypothetical protein [Lachnospiraceae bacterium]MDD3795733.1 hypothetical protein [Lachnospiraceae bacterium]